MELSINDLKTILWDISALEDRYDLNEKERQLQDRLREELWRRDRDE